MRCPACGAFVSEWAAACRRCGADVTGEPLVGAQPAPAAQGGGTPSAWTRWPQPRPLVVVFGVALALLATDIAAIPTIRTRPPSSSAAVLRPFVPPVRRDGSEVVLPVTLLDGRRLELRYPDELVVAQLGLTLATEIAWPVRGDPAQCCWVRLSASQATLAGAYGKVRPLATYRGATADRVTLVSSIGRRLPPGFAGRRNLVFQVDGWLVEVDTSPMGLSGAPPQMTTTELRALATNLQPSRAPGGYVVVQPRPPLTFASRSLLSSTAAVFGLGSPNEPQGNTLAIEDGYCGQLALQAATRKRFQTGDGLAGVTWCDERSGLLITAVGQERFVDLAASDLTLDLLSPGGARQDVESQRTSHPGIHGGPFLRF